MRKFHMICGRQWFVDFTVEMGKIRMKRQERSARLVPPSALLPLCELGLAGLELWTFYTLQACMTLSGVVAARITD